MNPLGVAAANKLWVASCRAEWRRFQRALGRVKETQTGLLKGYLAANGDTDYGRRYNFAALDSIEAFQASAPLTSYDDYAEPIDAIGRGRRGVLTAQPVRMFELSSGSTAPSKLIPYTASLKSEFQRGLAPWIYDLYTREPQLKNGPAYWSITPLTDVPRTTPGGIPVGFEADSAYLGAVGQRLVESVLAVPSAVKHIRGADGAAFRYVSLLFLLRQPELRLISIWHPTFLNLLLAPLPEWWPALLDDIARGTLTPPAPLGAGLRRALLPRLRPNPRRAEELAAIEPRDTLAIWPGLRLLSCWADGSAAGYAQTLSQAHFPGVRLQPKGLLATEAFVSFPLGGEHVLAVTAHFFEFLPLDGDLEPAADSPRLAHQLERGRAYAVVVTTGGGFYRYALHDIVEVVGHLGQAPCLRFVGKTDLVSDWFGEKLNERFVAQVLETVCRRGGLSPRFSLLAPDETAGSPRYTLYLELVPGQRANDAAPAAQDDLERLLCENFHYAYCRRLGQLAPARVIFTPPGAAERYLAACQARGQRLGNIKPALLQKTSGWDRWLAKPAEEGAVVL